MISELSVKNTNATIEWHPRVVGWAKDRDDYVGNANSCGEVVSEASTGQQRLNFQAMQEAAVNTLRT